MLIPTRVVLEGRQRGIEVTLKNIGKVKATYRVHFKEMRMTPDGQLKDREKSAGEVTATDLIRYSPRQVELEPGEAQTVRLQLRKPAELPEGEYRSHMVFQGVPPAEPPAPPQSKVEKELSFSVRPIYGIAIPVIVRHGEIPAEVKLTQLVFSEATNDGMPPLVTLHLERTGNRSVLGDFEATVESGGKLKKGTSLMVMKGVAVYPDIAFREVLVPLRLEKGETLHGCRLKITFTPKDFKTSPISEFLDIP
jgi:P pilus assembly chaperone PapD